MSMNEEMRRLMEAADVKNNKTSKKKKKITENKRSRSNDFSTFKSLNESCGCKSYDCTTCYPKDKLDEGVLGMANIGRSSTSETFVGRAGDAGNTLSNTGMGGYTGMVSASKDYDSESEDEYDLEKDPAMKSAYDDYVGDGPQTMYVAVDSEGKPYDFSDDEEYLRQAYEDDPDYEVKRANVTVELLEKEIRKNKKDKLMDERDSMRGLMDTINEAQEGKSEKEKLDETVLGMSNIGSTFVSATSESKFTEDEHDDDLEVTDREDDEESDVESDVEIEPTDDYEVNDPDAEVDVPDAPGVKDLDFDTEDTSELIAAIDQMQQMGMSLSDKHFDVSRLEDMPRSAVERIHNAVVVGGPDEDEEDFE